MIHFAKEGQPMKVGLNITVGSNGLFPWIAFVWTWYVPSTQILTHWRLRIRTWRFAIFTGRVDTWVVMDYLIKYDQRLITRELIEDIRLHAYMNNDITLNALLDRYKLPSRYE